jgi:hypothetical protein
MSKPVKLGNNGRVDMNGPSTKNLFAMYDKIPAHQCSTFRDPTEGLWTDTQLSDIFFSKQNIQLLQNGIRAGVYERSNGQYVIGPQDCDSLKIIMRSVFYNMLQIRLAILLVKLPNLTRLFWTIAFTKSMVRLRDI